MRVTTLYCYHTALACAKLHVSQLHRAGKGLSTKSALSTLVAEMDGISAKHGIVVIATTTHAVSRASSRVLPLV
jgi:hypothetical protein